MTPQGVTVTVLCLVWSLWYANFFCRRGKVDKNCMRLMLMILQRKLTFILLFKYYFPDAEDMLYDSGRGILLSDSTEPLWLMQVYISDISIISVITYHHGIIDPNLIFHYK